MPTSLRERAPRRGRVTLAFAAAIAIAAAAGGAQAQPSDADAAHTGHLIAFSEPSGAYVFVDGLLLGRTPLRSVALTPGTYTIWFRTRPPLSFEPEPLPERTFTVVAGDSVLIQERMGSLVRIETTPPDAKVTVGGRPAGRTPVEFRWQPLRSGDVRLHLDGYRPRRVPDATLERGGEVHVRLTPLPERVVPAESPSLERSVSRFNWPAWGSLAAGVAAAGLAVHFKSEADDAYDRYQGAALPTDQERYLDDSNRLDRLSALSWVAAEGGFLAALWFFAKDVLAVDDVPAEPVLRFDGDRTAVGFRIAY